ncbi:hypothetical protein, partial [Bacteroides heparinolyticus]|uniref:hypothetical protein n=1 Tax=Prevotella heparinolytica TaxID=28113 RepID=UPI0035A0DC88
MVKFIESELVLLKKEIDEMWTLVYNQLERAGDAVNNPEHPEEGSHFIEFSRELWIERDDFMEDAPKKYFRMTP